MHIDRVPNRGSKPTVLLRKSCREGKRVRKQTLANISHWPDPQIDALSRILKGETLVPASEAFTIERSLPHGHVAAVLGLLRALGLEPLLGSRRTRRRDLLVAMIVARVLNPASKLATARGLGEKNTTLAECLEIEGVDEDELYDAMDWLLKRQPRIERALAKKHLREGQLVLYDLTSTYFEGRCCPLARIGYSRDGKKNKLQINFGLLTDAEGCPVAVEVFEGNTGDPTTLAPQVHKLQQRFGFERVVVVGDRGMITDARIREDLRPNDLDWITALRAPALKKLVESGAIQLSLFDEKDLAEVTDSENYPDERLIVCKNPLLAQQRARKREELLEATEKELDKIVRATERTNRPLRGSDKIGQRVGKVQGRFKVAKHFHFEIGEESFQYRRNETSIAQEAALDGLYVLRTTVAKAELEAEQVVESYKGLSRVERSFRSLKTVDLKVRPIFHRRPSRVRAHVFLCMLAYYVQYHMRRRLAPLLFDDEDREGAEALRSSPVAPAQRSASARAKAATKKTTDGFPVHSFQGLLEALGTLCKNRVRPQIPNAYTFDLLTEPTPFQQRAFDLLGVPIR